MKFALYGLHCGSSIDSETLGSGGRLIVGIGVGFSHLDRLSAQRGAHLDELEITVKPKGAVDAAIARRFADAGVDRLVLHPSSVYGTSIDELIDDAGQHLIGQI